MGSLYKTVRKIHLSVHAHKAENEHPYAHLQAMLLLLITGNARTWISLKSRPRNIQHLTINGQYKVPHEC